MLSTSNNYRGHTLRMSLVPKMVLMKEEVRPGAVFIK